MRIAIISDLHCKHSSSERNGKSTLLYSDDIKGTHLNNPVKALKRLIADKVIKCDVILCPGDIADKGDPQGLSSGWTYLEDVKRETDAKLLVAAVGNHDVNIHCTIEEHPNSLLKELSDNYPFPVKYKLHDRFWNEDFCLLANEEVLIFVFNSCHTHKDVESSRVSSINLKQLERIKAELGKIDLESFSYKVALCHHHPINHGNISNPDNDLISNGDDLVSILESAGFQILVHGHKHEPKLSYKDSMAIFCAGSLSSTQNVLDLRIENTFHIIDIVPNQPMGTIETYVLIPKKGWIQKNGTYFPTLTGFGIRTDIHELAERSIAHLKKESLKIKKFEYLVTDIPELKYLTPKDQQLYSNALEKMNAELIPDFPDQPIYIGLKIE